MNNPTYLGDAVYAYSNGYAIELRLNSHDAPTAVHLDATCIEKLNAFVAAIKAGEVATITVD